MLKLLDAAVDLIHRFGTVVCIPALTGVITADVIMRYLFRMPFDWSVEFGETMLLLILFGSLPYTTKVNGHVRMELLYRHFRGFLLRLANALWAMADLFFSILLAVRVAEQIPFMIRINRNLEYLGLPVWILHAFVLACAALMAIYFLYQLFFGVRKMTGEDDWEARMARMSEGRE